MISTLLRPFLDLVGTARTIRAAVLAVVYGATLALSLWLAYQFRFDFNVPGWSASDLMLICGTAIVLKLGCMAAFHQFDGLLTYFSTPDLKRLLGACASGSLLLGILWFAGGIQVAPPRGVILTDFVLCVTLFSGVRLGFREIRTIASTHGVATNRAPRRVGIVGAGDSGAALARDLLAKPWLALQPVAFFDDYHSTECSVHGIDVVGRPERICELSEKLNLNEIIIAMPSASVKRVREVVKFVQAVGLPCRTVPSLDQFATGRLTVSSLRAVEIQDLLGRSPVTIETAAVREVVEGRTVMVTGAGGSIGSELCRQILSFRPAALLLVERSEPQLFVIEQELRGIGPEELVIPVIGDITQEPRMRRIFRRFRPQVVFHAAAHKHVPMMEFQPEEAIRNNIVGTAQLAELAIEYGVERFVFISTDKAVNPSSVMGATKRFAEIYLQSLSTRSHHTKFMAVRFGNVLGSSGSVVPTFAKQIAAGGPVTVTHPDVTRFFMTIPEAVTLVLQSAAMSKGGAIFVLDMGRPIKILDLALQMIELSGLRPYEDIEIRITGLRNGEKLHEELTSDCEKLCATEHPRITRLVLPPQNYCYTLPILRELITAISDGSMESDDLKRLLSKAIPEYTPFNSGKPHQLSSRVVLPFSPPASGLPQLLIRTGSISEITDLLDENQA